jgi:hypothetical protein
MGSLLSLALSLVLLANAHADPTMPWMWSLFSLPTPKTRELAAPVPCDPAWLAPQCTVADCWPGHSRPNVAAQRRAIRVEKCLRLMELGSSRAPGRSRI